MKKQTAKLKAKASSFIINYHLYYEAYEAFVKRLSTEEFQFNLQNFIRVSEYGITFRKRHF